MPIELAISEVNLGRRVLFTALIRDISPRKEAEREMRIKESAIQSSINAIALADLDGRITYVNKAWAGMWDMDEKKPGQNGALWDLFGKTGPESIGGPENHEWFGEIEVKPRRGRTAAVQLSANMVTDVDGAPICFMASLVDVTARKKAEEQLKLQATIDALTGLLNRREFMERFESDFKAARRHDLSLCVAHVRPGPLQKGERHLWTPGRGRRAGRLCPAAEDRHSDRRHRRQIRRRRVRHFIAPHRTRKSGQGA